MQDDLAQLQIRRLGKSAPRSPVPSARRRSCPPQPVPSAQRRADGCWCHDTSPFPDQVSDAFADRIVEYVCQVEDEYRVLWTPGTVASWRESSQFVLYLSKLSHAWDLHVPVDGILVDSSPLRVCLAPGAWDGGGGGGGLRPGDRMGVCVCVCVGGGGGALGIP